MRSFVTAFTKFAVCPFPKVEETGPPVPIAAFLHAFLRNPFKDIFFSDALPIHSPRFVHPSYVWSSVNPFPALMLLLHLMPKKVHSASYSQTHLAYLFPLTETPK